MAGNRNHAGVTTAQWRLLRPDTMRVAELLNPKGDREINVSIQDGVEVLSLTINDRPHRIKVERL